MSDPTHQPLAVFDVCQTLYFANTTADYIEFHHRVSRNRTWSTICRLVRSRLSPVRYLLISLSKLGLGDAPRNVLLTTLKGQSRSQLQNSARRYVAEWLPAKKIIESHALLRAAQEDGASVVLLSSSLDIVVCEIAKVLRVDWRASELSFADDLCSGRLGSDLTGRKAVELKNIIAGFSSRPSVSVCTDNATDADILALANRRYIIHHSPKIHQSLRDFDAEFIRVTPS